MPSGTARFRRSRFVREFRAESSWKVGLRRQGIWLDGNARHLPVAWQAGSKDPVRRRVVEKDGSRGGCGPSAGRAGKAVFGRTLSRREYPEITASMTSITPMRRNCKAIVLE